MEAIKTAESPQQDSLSVVTELQVIKTIREGLATDFLGVKRGEEALSTMVKWDGLLTEAKSRVSKPKEKEAKRQRMTGEAESRTPMLQILKKEWKVAAGLYDNTAVRGIED